jgi:hypothetical protein
MFPTLHGLNLSLSLYYPYISLFIYLSVCPTSLFPKNKLKRQKGKMKDGIKRVMKSNQSMPLFNSPYGCNHHLKEIYFCSVLEVKSAFAFQGPTSLHMGRHETMGRKIF